MEPGSVVWHKAGGFPFWPYVVVTPDNVNDKLQLKLKTLAMGVALRCLPLELPLYDVAASNKLEPWTPENCEKHTAACRKDKRKTVGGQIDAALSEAEQIVAGTLKISAPEPVGPPSPAPVPSAGKKTMLKLKGTGAKPAAATEPEASAAAAASPAPAPSGQKLKLKVGGGTGTGAGGKACAGGKSGKGSTGHQAAEGEVGATATESNAGTVVGEPAPTSGAGGEGKADSSVPAEAESGTGAEGSDWVAPTHRMTKVRAKLLGLKPPSAVAPAIAPGRPAPVPAPIPSGTGTGVPQTTPQPAAPGAVEEQFMLVKGKKKEKEGKHKDKHREKDGKQGREKRTEKDDRRSSGAAAATAVGKRKTVVDDSEEEGDEQHASSPSASAAAAATVQQPSSEVVDSEDVPVLVKKRKRVERQVEEDEDDEEDDDEDAGMGLAALYSSSIGGKRKKAKKAQKSRAAADGDDAEGEEVLSAEAGKGEEESPYPPGIPPPPHPMPAEADYERAHTLYTTLTGCIASGDGQGLINALTSLLSSTGLPVSTDLLQKSKLVEAVKPLRKLEAGVIPAESPLASDSDLQSEVRESADMVYRRFQAECRELAAWQETHKEAMRDWQARRARRKAEQARIAKMQEGKKRRAEERAAEEQARMQARTAQEAAQAQAQASHAGDMMELDTAQEQDESTKLPEASSTEQVSLLASQEQLSASSWSAPLPAPTSALPSTHQAAKAAVVPAPPKPVQIATAASLLGLVAVKAAAADGKPGSASAPSGGGASTPPVLSASASLSAAVGLALEKDLAIQLPTNATRLAGVHLLTALLAQIAVNTRDSERDIVTAAGGSRMPGGVGADSALFCVVQKIATVLDSKLAAALQNPSAANVLPQEPLAALRAVMLALDRTCEAFARPDARALTLPLLGAGSVAAAAAGGKSSGETVTATRKLLAVLSEAGSRLRAVPSAAAQGMSTDGRGPGPAGSASGASEAGMLSQQERDVLAQALPLVPSVLREAFKGQ